MVGDSLGTRMKRYEDVTRNYLTDKLPVVIRLDGKAFHTWTRGLSRPYCQSLMAGMNEVTLYLARNVQNCVLAYTQSDEISLVLSNLHDVKSTAWFDGNIQKVVSVAAGMASAKLTAESPKIFGDLRDEPKLATFDARVFVLPVYEVENYLIWRQQDWERNSIQMLAQSLYSHKELQGKGRADLHEMCFQKGVNWAELSSHIKNGRLALKETVLRPVGPTMWLTQPQTFERHEWRIQRETPLFKDSKELIRKLVSP